VLAFTEGRKLSLLSKALAGVDTGGAFKHVVYWGTPDAAAVEVRS
jgi:hypothetical protein